MSLLLAAGHILLQQQERTVNTENVKAEIQLDNELFNEEQEVRKRFIAYHEKRVQFRVLQQYWRQIDDKRDRLQQRAEMLDLLVRVAFLMGLVSLTIYINLAPPTPDEYPLNSFLLVVWGSVAVVACFGHMTVLLLASRMYVLLLDISTRESPVHSHFLSCPPPRAAFEVTTVAEFEEIWNKDFDPLYWRLLHIFSATMTLSFGSLLTLAHVKFFMSPPAAWTSCILSALGFIIWLKYHVPFVTFLSMSATHTRAQSRARTATHAATHAAT
mmetsp:Transcript_21548/g.34522  ORF Transcript_21548/g.34522 Transcript_21548/m.34522 type:complete len:271 (-) Transcript_21548:49-861(-)